MNETIKILTSRKSARSYLDKHVPRELLDEIVAAGLNAPSGRNMQTARFVVVTNDETVALLSQLNGKIGGMPFDPFYGAKDVIVVLAKKECTYLYDGSLAMGNLLNAAWSLGIDCRWIHRAKEVFQTDTGKELLTKWGVADGEGTRAEDLEGIGFCILGYAQEEKEKTAIHDGRVFYD